MRAYRADLHLHTLLSACAEVEMIPPLIVDEALQRGLDILAITDHNATGNAWAVMEAARGTNLTIIPGMELLTQEEVDLVCLFPSLEQARLWQQQVDAALPPLKNDAEHFGPQFLVDPAGEFLAEEERLLQIATRISLSEAVQAIHALDGLAIPAHIERSHHGLLGVLGLWPDDLETDAAELSPNLRPSQARQRYPFLPPIPLITSSDSHMLDSIGNVLTVFTMEAPTLTEMRLALHRIGGRSVTVP